MAARYLPCYHSQSGWNKPILRFSFALISTLGKGKTPYKKE